MKVIDIGNRVIYINTIEGLYKNDYSDAYYVETSRGDYKITKTIYYQLKALLLSLNDVQEDTPKEDKKLLEKLEMLPENEHYSNKVLYGKINEIIDKINGE